MARNPLNTLPFHPAFKILSEVKRKASACIRLLLRVSGPSFHSRKELFWVGLLESVDVGVQSLDVSG